MNATMTDDRARVATDRALAYLLAGNAYVTFRNTKSGTRFTYRVRRSEPSPVDGREPVHFVSALTGPDNTEHYSYLGAIFGGKQFRWTRKSRVSKDAPSFKAFEWVFNRLVTEVGLPDSVEVWHEGRCCKCGRRLTVPESIESGIGPDCAGRER